MTADEALQMLPSGQHIRTIYNSYPDPVPHTRHRAHVMRLLKGADRIRKTPECLKFSAEFGLAVDTGMGTIFMETAR